MTNTQLIFKEAEKIISGQASGIRYSDLHKAVQAELPKQKYNMITGALHKLRGMLPTDKIYMPARGLYKHVKFKQASEGAGHAAISQDAAAPAEEEFYGAFATWLVEDRQECTKAIALGGSKFKNKWGTPDVIGVRKHFESDILKPPTEVVSAEVKTDSTALITAFGQACAYRLFSHKSYMVVPSDSSPEDMERLEALAIIFGIGLVRFDKCPKNPKFKLCVPAFRHEPDIFYANENLKHVEKELFG